jgi:nickel-dependent lactate racemase
MSPLSHFKLSSGAISTSLGISSDESLVSLPTLNASAADLCVTALRNPLGFPDLIRCVVPGDQVILAIDPETPFLSEIIPIIWEQLQSIPDGGVLMTLLLPEDPSGQGWQWIRESLPLHIQQQLTVQIHDPNDRTQISYIASSAAGERIYLNRLLSDADLIVTIGLITFDGLLGFRGTSSSLYPAFSDAATVRESRTQGHPELTPEQQRPFRDLVDEVGWLLGTQFTVQVIAGSAEAPAAVLAGLPDAVMNHGRELVNRIWRFSLDEPMDAVVLSVPGGAAFGWRQLGIALENASQLVTQGGRIIVVADLLVPEGPAATMLRRCQEPEDLLKPLRREPTFDSVEISQLIKAERRARIYLFSRLEADVVEELGMFPVADDTEFRRLVESVDKYRILPFANYAWCEVAERV